MPKLSEGQYVLGALTIFTIWVFFVLPFLYGPPPRFSEAHHLRLAQAVGTTQDTQREPDGTIDAPFVVRVLPAPKTPEEAAQDLQERHERANTDWWLAAFTGAVALFTLMLVGATILLWLAGERQIRVVEGLVEAAKDSAATAKVSAEAATEGAQASRDSVNAAKLDMVARGRAYVHYGGCRWRSHRRDDSSPAFWRINPQWANVGSSPPRNLHVYTHYELLDSPLPHDYSFTPSEHVQIPAMIPPGGLLSSASRDFWGTDLAAVKEGNKHLYIWGTARYRDIFPDTPERITRFCVVATNVTGDPTAPWDDNNNKMEITFSTYHEHNCADEECNESH